MRRIALAGLVASAGIIMTGAAVRLSQSGLGCPDWPACTVHSIAAGGTSGSSLVHRWIEFGNRLLTGAILVISVLVAVAAWRFRPGGSRRPDVVVLDLQLPDISGVEVTRGLRTAYPGARVLILSASGEQRNVLDAVKAGAAGYIVKSAGRTELLDAVRRTASGDAVFSPGLAGLVLGEYRKLAASPGPGTPQLTEREAEVLRMVGTGLSYKQIAERLVISHRTVQNHVQNTLAKLQLHNRVELVRYAIEHGLDAG